MAIAIIVIAIIKKKPAERTIMLYLGAVLAPIYSAPATAANLRIKEAVQRAYEGYCDAATLYRSCISGGFSRVERLNAKKVLREYAAALALEVAKPRDSPSIKTYRYLMLAAKNPNFLIS